MNSFFSCLDKELNPCYQFWTKVQNPSPNPIKDPEIHSSFLQVLNKTQQLRQKHFILTQSHLFSCKSPEVSPDKFSVISWKSLELYYKANTESNKLEKLTQIEILDKQANCFIFRLIGEYSSKDFYTESKEVFQQWVNVLSTLTVLRSFDNDFSIVQEIGGGSHSTVYLAIHNITGIKYAVKAISKEDFDQSFRTHESLGYEISTMRKLCHPFIVKLYFVYENDQFVYFVLDYLPAGNLFQRIIQKARFSEDSASKIMKNLLQALQYIHSLNLIYRDLKPHNILLSSETCDFSLKLTNFSLVCDSLDNLNHLCGSPGYVAPEILKKKPYSKKADVFSAGIILFTLLSGKAPFVGKKPGEILTKNKECKISFQDKYWKNISKEGIDCVLKLTDSDPEFRPTAAEALEFEWFKIPLSNKVEVVKDPNVGEDSGISAELMRRMNRVRGKEGSNKKEDEEAKGGAKVINNPRNILGRLRIFDSSLG